ncbi:hypothetical protein DdX_19854 [Ditylenchus destructor]|uniref:Uncharacterized protein n=1 Tax=Ditylenchus destructor TaxID=166010 RepID=A0AAD4MIA9_9BILA|nr:hypothetical protein DdX_19854 [Ditylenchus destructor]
MNKIALSHSVKRPGSLLVEASESEVKKRSREKVEVLEDVWLEALRYLTCLKWSKMRLVSLQLKELIQKNVSRLPLVIISSVEMRLTQWNFQKQREKTESKIIASDSLILSDQKIKWFKDRGITLYLPADIELDNANYGLHFMEKRSFDLRVQGDSEKFNASVLFNAEFSPSRNPYSWLSLAYFLKLIYDQSTFVKELSMYAIDKKLKDILFSAEKERYIRCRSLKLQVTGCDKLCESVSWLEQNVQADRIEMPVIFIDYRESEICDAISNFVLGASWVSASQEVNLGHVNALKDFFRAMIKKFQTLSAVQNTFPIISFEGNRLLGSFEDEQIKRLLSGKEELEDSEEENDGWHYSEDEKKGKTYTISNGANRMRVEFMEPPERGPRAFKCAARIRPSKFDIRVTVEAGF